MNFFLPHPPIHNPSLYHCSNLSSILKSLLVLMCLVHWTLETLVTVTLLASGS